MCVMLCMDTLSLKWVTCGLGHATDVPRLQNCLLSLPGDLTIVLLVPEHCSSTRLISMSEPIRSRAQTFLDQAGAANCRAGELPADVFCVLDTLPANLCIAVPASVHMQHVLLV